MYPEAERLGVAWRVADCGAEIVDCGIDVPGSPEAGRLFALACLGGSAGVTLSAATLEGRWTPSVKVRVGEPVRSCLASQYAGWMIKDGESGYFAMGSGPARALYRGEALFREIGCVEESDAGLIALEARSSPPESVLRHIASCCRVEPEKLMVLIAPTASIVGSVQVAARVVETGLHKLHTLGFDVSRVLAGWGEAPIAPVASDDGRAIGRTNDAILYGGRVWYTVDCGDEQITGILPKLPACCSADYGTPFYELLARASWDFYQIDPMLFSPAEVTVNNIRSGRTFTAGRMNEALLAEQWFGADA